MFSWAGLGKLALDALQPPDPKSPTERLKRVWERVVEAGDAVEVVNRVLATTDTKEEENT